MSGAAFHVARTGAGRPLLLLHGWPEFWLSWEPVMKRLADRYTLIAPDLRGFGDSTKPAGPFGPADHAADILALLDALGVARVGVIGHDVGGAAMQPLARTTPERLAGLFLFGVVYPGIGPRMAAPDRLNEIWYRSFNQMEMAPDLVGATREGCRTFIAHFLRHWSHRKEAFDDVIEAFTDNFLKPGPSTIRCFRTTGPTGLARVLAISTSRSFRASDTFPIAKIPIVPPPRSRPSSSAWVGAEIEGSLAVAYRPQVATVLRLSSP